MTRKAKRKLSDIDFSSEGSHVALVSKDQGGGANECNYTLIMKSLNFNEEMIQKMQQVRVTLELPDFLRKFFGLYYDDAEVLARMLGYVENETEDSGDYYENYIQSQLDSFEILKSMHDGKSMTEVLKSLSAEEYLALLKDQENLEIAIENIEKKSNTSNKGTKEGSQESNVIKTKVEPSTKTKRGKNMDELEQVQKALADQTVELQKALSAIADFEAKAKESVKKARLAQVVDAVKDQSKAEILFKSLSLVENEEDFNASVKALAEMQVAVEKSALFSEQGRAVEEEIETQESAVAKVIKAKYKLTKE